MKRIVNFSILFCLFFVVNMQASDRSNRYSITRYFQCLPRAPRHQAARSTSPSIDAALTDIPASGELYTTAAYVAVPIQTLSQDSIIDNQAHTVLDVDQVKIQSRSNSDSLDQITQHAKNLYQKNKKLLTYNAELKNENSALRLANDQLEEEINRLQSANENSTKMLAVAQASLQKRVQAISDVKSVRKADFVQAQTQNTRNLPGDRVIKSRDTVLSMQAQIKLEELEKLQRDFDFDSLQQRTNEIQARYENQNRKYQEEKDFK